MILPDGFEHIYFLLVSLILLLCVFGVFFIKKGAINFSQTSLLFQVYKKTSLYYYIFLFLLFSISVFYILLLSIPYISQNSETIIKDGIDIELILDVSYSMNAADISPSRIQGAKKVLRDFISQLESDRVGIILFAGKPFQSVPLSFDYNFIDSFIEDISSDIIDQGNPQLAGTAIGDALVLGADTLEKENKQREKVIILITDGEANTGIDPLIALKYLQDKNIKVYSIGVGRDEESYVEVVLGGGFMQRIPVGPVDEETLKKISSSTGGKYFRAESENSFAQVFESISQLEKSEIEYKKVEFKTPVFGGALTILLVLYMCLGYIVFVKKIRL